MAEEELDLTELIAILSSKDAYGVLARRRGELIQKSRQLHVDADEIDHLIGFYSKLMEASLNAQDKEAKKG